MHFSPAKTAIGIGLIFICLYSISATPTPTGIADADELVQTSYFLSVAHPPGFPLFTLLGHIGISILGFLVNPAYAGNLLSGFYTSISMVFFYLTGKKLYKSQTKALAATTLFGLSYFIWIYATVYEITSFTLLLATVTLHFGLDWYQSSSSKSYLLTWIFAGLLLSHFHPAILYFPALLWLIIAQKKVSLKSFSIGFFSLILTTVIASLSLLLLNPNAPISWDLSSGIQGWWHHFTRQDYIGIDEESGILYQTTFAVPQLLNLTAFQSYVLYFNMLLNHFNLIAILIIIPGIYYLWKKDRVLFWFCTLLFLISGPLFAAYMQISSYTFQANLLTGIAERHLILGDLALAMFILPGILQIQRLVKSKQIFTVLLLTATGLQFWSNKDILFKPESRSFNYSLQKQKVLDVPPNSLIICSTDVDCYTLWYITRVEQIRPDVIVLSHVPVYSSHYLKSNPDIYPFDQTANPGYLSLLIAHNFHQRPIYLTSGINFYDIYLGLENGPFFLLPENNMFKLTNQYPKNVNYQPPPIVPAKIDHRNLYSRGIIEVIANNQAYAGYLSLKYGQTDIANQFLSSASALDSTSSQIQELIHNQKIIIPSISVSDPNLSPQKLIIQAQEADKLQQPNEANTYFRLAFLSGGNNPDIISAALNYYQRTNQLSMIEDLNQLLRYNNQAPE